MPKKRAASPAQIAANKANAPCDLSQDTTLPYEHEEFEAVLAGLTRDHQPQTTTEAILIERLAQLNHRLRRSLRIETAMLDSNSNDVIAHRRRFPDPPGNDPKRTRDNWTLSSAYTRSGSEVHLLAHYESRLSRDFARTLTQLYGVKNFSKQTQPIPERPQPERTGPLAGESRERAPLCAINQTPSDGQIAQVPAKQTQTPPPINESLGPSASPVIAPDVSPGTITALPTTPPDCAKNEQTNQFPRNPLIPCLLPSIPNTQTSISGRPILGQEETRS